MKRTDIGSEDLLNAAVGDLGLTISLWVMGCGHVELRSKCCKQGLPECRGDAGVTVGDNDMRKTLFREHMINEEMSELL